MNRPKDLDGVKRMNQFKVGKGGELRVSLQVSVAPGVVNSMKLVALRKKVSVSKLVVDCFRVCHPNEIVP